MIRVLTAFLCLLLFACSKKSAAPDTPPPSQEAALYFPPVGGNSWETQSPASLGWNTTALDTLAPFLQRKNTKAFLILKNGRIVYERYFGTFTADSNWYWASAGKTAAAALAGIAVREGRLNPDARASQYLGTGWTSAPAAKEQLITVRHLLTMSSGLDDGVADDDCTTPACLQYRADAGTRWAYHNGPYNKVHDVLEAALGMSFNSYFASRIRNPIGMNGAWINSGPYNLIYASTARSMARFGLLLLNRGNWNGTAIVDAAWWQAMVQPSQTLNRSYGYLTWLNGQSSYMVPVLPQVFNGALIAAAPADLFAGLGKNDQKVYVSRAQGLVVIRMGDSAGVPALAPSSFDNEVWVRLRTIIGGW